MPFTIYETFWIEEKWGFNKMTPTLFITDKIKKDLLMLTFVPIPVVGLIKIIQWAGEEQFAYYCIVFI